MHGNKIWDISLLYAFPCSVGCHKVCVVIFSFSQPTHTLSKGVWERDYYCEWFATGWLTWCIDNHCAGVFYTTIIATFMTCMPNNMQMGLEFLIWRVSHILEHSKYVPRWKDAANVSSCFFPFSLTAALPSLRPLVFFTYWPLSPFPFPCHTYCSVCCRIIIPIVISSLRLGLPSLNCNIPSEDDQWLHTLFTYIHTCRHTCRLHVTHMRYIL